MSKQTEEIHTIDEVAAYLKAFMRRDYHHTENGKPSIDGGETE